MSGSAGAKSLAQAQEAAHGQVAEGVKSCSSIRDLAARTASRCRSPKCVHRVCHDSVNPRQMAAELLGRARKAER